MKLLTPDRGFYQKLAAIALPMALRNLVTFSLNMLDTVMMGSLGEVPLAAAGVANQPYFIFSLFIFGLSSGGCILASQYWGRRDEGAVNRILGMVMFFAVIFSVLLALAVGAAPQLVMGLYAEDEAVIREGCGYLRLVAPSYVISAVSTVYLSLCRSVEQVKVPLKINVFALCLNAVLNYIFIFGAFGLPAMGLTGAGLATLLARAAELAAVILFQRNFILRFQLRFLFHFDKPLLKDFVKYSAPVVLNETLWSVGISLHSVMLGKLGYEVLAAYNVAQVLEKLANVAMFGISDATIVILAGAIGAGQSKPAVYSYAKTVMTLGFCVSALCGALLFLCSGAIFHIYDLDARTVAFGEQLIRVTACFLPFRALSSIGIVGVIRSGGKTKISMLIDLGALWLVGIPLGAVFVHLRLPLYIIYSGFMADQLVKGATAVLYVRTKRWICNITKPSAVTS